MIYIRVKYDTKVSNGIDAHLEDYVSTMNATAIEAEAQPSRFVWNTADGLGMAIEYSRMKHLCINRIEVDPINAATVSAALLYGCPHPKPPCPPPPPCPCHNCKVVIVPDNTIHAHYKGFFAPGCHHEVQKGHHCSVVITAEEHTKILKVFANGEELNWDCGSTDKMVQCTFTVKEDTFITVHYVTIQKG